MAIIDKKFIHFKNYDDFISQAGVGSVDNITTPTSGSEDTRNAVYGQIKGSSIVFIKDTKQIWTHGQLYSCNVDVNSLEDVVRVDDEGYINKDKLIIGEVPSWVLEVLDFSKEDFVDTDSLCTISSGEDESSKRVIAEIVNNGYKGENSLEYRPNENLITISSKETGGYGTTQYTQTMPLITVDGKLELDEENVSRASYTVNDQASDVIQQMCIGAPDGIGHTSGVYTYSEAASLVSMVSYEDEQTGEWIENGTDLTVTADGVFVNGTPLALGVTPITYSELVTLRNNNQLIPGTMYRITDYETKLSEHSDLGASGDNDHMLWMYGCIPEVEMYFAVKNYYFDIVVVALSSNEISEQAYAVHSSRDVEGHFTNRNLSAWKIYYRLENKHDFWVIPNTAKGVIYKLINEYGNEAPYDFENVYYGNMPVFGSNCKNNIIEGYYITLGSNCHSNHIGKNSVRIKIGNHSSGNTFGVACRGIVLGSYCDYNTFGNNCVYRYDADYGTFGGGFWINKSTPRNYCSYNTFANGCAPHLECPASANISSKLQHLCILTNSYDYLIDDGSYGGPELKTSASISLPLNIINSGSEIRIGTNSQGEVRIYRLEDLIN